MTGPLSPSQVATSFAAQTGIPGTVSGPVFTIDPTVVETCCDLNMSDLFIAFTGTLRYTADFDCCPPTVPPVPAPAPFEMVSLESEWLNVSQVGNQVAITPTHPNPSLYFIPIRRYIAQKANATYINPRATLSLIVNITGPQLGPFLMPFDSLQGRCQAEPNLFALPSGSPIVLGNTAAANTTIEPFVKVFVTGTWVPLSIC